MTAERAVLDFLAQHGPAGRAAIEAHLERVGYAPSGITRTLAALKRKGAIVHLRRASRHVSSLYGLESHERGTTSATKRGGLALD